MLKYLQPDFYKFNQDSIKLVNFALHNLDAIRFQNIIDVGCGSGVIGIEYYLKQKCQVDFLEIQKEFLPFLKKNIEAFELENFKIINQDLASYRPTKKYDLVLVNPPYFIKENSRIGLNIKKNRCRMIPQNELVNFCKSLSALLNQSAYLVICWPKQSVAWADAIQETKLVEVKSLCHGKIKYSIFENI